MKNVLLQEYTSIYIEFQIYTICRARTNRKVLYHFIVMKTSTKVQRYKRHSSVKKKKEQIKKSRIISIESVPQLVNVLCCQSFLQDTDHPKILF